jgi:hypothetical protein
VENAKSRDFCSHQNGYNSSMLLLLNARLAKQLVDTTSALLERVQRLEEEQATLRARLKSDPQVRVLFTQLANAAQAAPAIGAAMELFARSIRTAVPRGRPGGLARSRTARRYFDATFMPESEKWEAYRREYERYANGGRARAASAQRGSDGTFLCSEI